MGRRARWDDRVDARLGHTLNEIFLKIPAAEAKALFRRVEEEAGKAGLLYEDDDGQSRVVPLLVRPRVILPEQEQYFHKVCLQVTHAIEKLVELRQADKRVKEILPFTEREERWLKQLAPRAAKQQQTVVARLDANADFSAPDWDTAFDFFETNGVGVGGMYYAPTAADILMRVVIPVMQKVAPALVVKPQTDMRQILLEQVAIHARAIKKRRLNTAFLQDKSLIGGPNEFPYLVEYFRGKNIPAVHVDPRDLRLKGDEIYAGDLPIDVIYRDAEVGEYLDYEDEGADLSALKKAFQRNQVVSSLAGDLDHKSTFEVLTRPELAGAFTQPQRRCFKQHVLWTRVVRDVVTTDFDGEKIELLRFIRRNKDRLVLKPNRSFGGAGIVIGPHVDLADWDAAIEAALGADPEEGGTVVQRYVEVRVKDFPVLSEDGIHLEEFYVVCGFLATTRGVGILGRASKRRVVNVGQRGGLTAIVVMV